MLRIYWTSACPGCAIRAQCTTSPYRRIRRWEHEHLLEAMQRRLDRKPNAMTLRRRTIEHVFFANLFCRHNAARAVRLRVSIEIYPTCTPLGERSGAARLSCVAKNGMRPPCPDAQR